MASSIPPHLASASTSSNTSTPRAPRNRASPQSSPQNTSPRSRSPRGGPPAGLDVESLLRNNGGDVRKALEIVVAERNHLVSQNSQLWKLIEKQRSQSAHLNNDNERLRTDREKANVKLAAAGLETVGHVRKIPNSSSAVGLGIQADQAGPIVARRNSDREEAKPAVTQAPHTEPIAQSSRHSPAINPPVTSPPAASQSTLLPSAMPSKLRHESRMQFPPEVSSFMTLGDSPKDATHTIPALPASTSANTLSPSSQYSSYSSSPVASEKETSSGLAVPQSSRQLAVMTEEDEGDETLHLAPPRVSSLKSPSMESTSTHSSFHSAAQSPLIHQRRPDDLPRTSTDTETQIPFTNREIPFTNRETSRSTPDSHYAPPSQSSPGSDRPEPIQQQQHTEMTSPLLPHSKITVPETTIYLNPLNREVLCFIVSITVKAPNTEPVTWTVAKLLSAFIDLDAKLKTSSRKSSKEWRHMTAPLPDGKAWKDFAPAKISQRKSALEAYLKSLQVAPLSDKSDLCVFLSTDVVQAKEAAVRKEGYLAKKNNIFGSYKTRYFVLNGPVLEYFETRGGPSLGTITVTGAQIGKQGRLNEAAEERDSKHAFLILENHKKGTVTRHVMCAASDKERDGWIARLVEQVDPNSSPVPTPSTSPPPVVTSPPPPPSTQVPAPPPPGNAPGNGPAAGALQRKRSTSRKLSKDVIVTNAQPMGAMPTTGKFANIPSPGMINSLEANKSQSSQSSTSNTSNGSNSAPMSQSSTLMSMSETSQSVQSEPSNGRPSTSTSHHDTTTPRANKRQSNMPPTRQSSIPPSRQYTPAYLTKLSTDGMSAPPGAMPDTRDRDRKAKSGRFWPSFGKTPEKITRPVFGVPLNESLAIASVASLPAVVFRCIEWLEINKAQDEEGVYRMSGSSAVIKGLKDRFDHEGDVNLVKLDDRWDPHAIAGLLKTFLRELPTSLLTRELHPKFLAVMDLIDSSARVAELTRLVSDLPPPNYALLRSLTAHLILIVKHSHINKMTLRNIGIVFSPTLGIPAGIFSELVSHFGAIFDAEEEIPEEPVDLEPLKEEEGEGETTMRRNRNSMLYHAAGADAMLGIGGRSLNPTDDSASEASASVIDFSDTESQLPSQSGHSSGGEDQSSASPTTPRAVSSSAMRQKARGLDLGPNPISGNGPSNGEMRYNGNGNGHGHGHDGLPANPHPMEGVAK